MDVDRDTKGNLVYTYSRQSDENPNFKTMGDITLRSDEVLHIPGLGFDGLVGYSPIAMAKNAVGMCFVDHFLRKVFHEQLYLVCPKRNGAINDAPWLLRIVADTDPQVFSKRLNEANGVIF